jgi:hypothetical protein
MNEALNKYLAINPLSPSAEVVNLAAYHLLPLAGRMGREGEFGIGLFGSVREPLGSGRVLLRTLLAVRIG